MTLTAARNTTTIDGSAVPTVYELPAAVDVLYAGGMMCLNAAGFVVPAGSATGLSAVLGKLDSPGGNVDNSGGAAGDLNARILPGQHKWDNSGSSIASTDRGKLCYAVDDESVHISNASSRAVAGIITRVDTASDPGGAGVVVQTIFHVGAATQDALSANAHVDVPFDASWYEIDGTALAAFAGGALTTPGLVLDGSEGAGIRWNNHATPDPICRSVPVPYDLDNAFPVTASIICWKSGATLADATTFDVTVFNNVVGALYDADADYGGTSGAITGDAAAKTTQQSDLTLAAANLPDPTSAHAQLSVTVQPTDGTLGTDDITVGLLRLTYKRRV